MMKAIHFRLSGRVGHFLRAEAGASAFSYPVPSRTVLLGLIGAVLGLEKDQPQQVLENANIAISGKHPQTHWHKAKLRKDPPESLPMVVKKNQKQDKNTKPEKATLISQEWLVDPCYEVWVTLPKPYHTDFLRRVQQRQWYFQPCLGLSEMSADIEYFGEEDAIQLPAGIYSISTLIKSDVAKLDLQNMNSKEINVQLLQMPRIVTENRVFTHAKYIFPRNGQSINVQTDEAYQVGKRIVMFL